MAASTLKGAYALVIAVPRPDDPSLNELRTVGPSGERLGRLLSNDKGLFRYEKTVLLGVPAQPASCEQVRREAVRIGEACGENEAQYDFGLPVVTRVVVAFGGHGRESGALCLADGDMTVTELMRCFSQGIRKHHTGRIRTRFLLLLDACYSGAAVKEAMLGLRQHVQGVVNVEATPLHLDVISGTSPDKQAYELQSMKHSLFMSAVFDALCNDRRAIMADGNISSTSLLAAIQAWFSGAKFRAATSDERIVHATAVKAKEQFPCWLLFSDRNGERSVMIIGKSEAALQQRALDERAVRAVVGDTLDTMGDRFDGRMNNVETLLRQYASSVEAMKEEFASGLEAVLVRLGLLQEVQAAEKVPKGQQDETRRAMVARYRKSGDAAMCGVKGAAKSMLGHPLKTDDDMVEFAFRFGVNFKVKEHVSEDTKQLNQWRKEWHEPYMEMFDVCMDEAYSLTPVTFRFPAAGERLEYALLHMLLWESCKLHNRYNPKKPYAVNGRTDCHMFWAEHASDTEDVLGHQTKLYKMLESRVKEYHDRAARSAGESNLGIVSSFV